MDARLVREAGADEIVLLAQSRGEGGDTKEKAQQIQD